MSKVLMYNNEDLFNMNLEIMGKVRELGGVFQNNMVCLSEDIESHDAEISAIISALYLLREQTFHRMKPITDEQAEVYQKEMDNNFGKIEEFESNL